MNAPSGTTSKSLSARSVIAVFAGVMLIFVLTTAIDVALHAAGVYPPMGEPFTDRLCLIATSYRIVIGVVGGYITARLAPNRPVRHALWLGWVGVALSSIGAAATWNRGPAFGPHWYPLVLIAISLPCAWLGGKLASKKEDEVAG